MHRFWFFPLFVAAIGVLYPAFRLAQDWLIYLLCHSVPVGESFGDKATNLIRVSAVWNALLGVAVGLVVAINDFLRHARADPSGTESAGRLVINSFWLGVYSLFPSGCLILCFVLGSRSNSLHPAASALFYVLLPLVHLFGIINLTAILWALVRTVTTEDVLAPRVLLDKVRLSMTLTN